MKGPNNSFVPDALGILQRKRLLVSLHSSKRAPMKAASARNKVFLLESAFVGKQPTVLFRYPGTISSPDTRRFHGKVKESSDTARVLKFKISEKVNTYNCVVNSFLGAGFTQTTTSK